eukprot:5868072-Amphidinium_carterae.1
MELLLHVEELGEDVAGYAASCIKRTIAGPKEDSRRRRARRIGSGVTQSSLPTVQEEEEACDAFLERIDVAELDDFERRNLGGRAIFTRTLRSLTGPGCRSSDTSGASPTRMRSTLSEQAQLDVQKKNLHPHHITRSTSCAVEGMRSTS